MAAGEGGASEALLGSAGAAAGDGPRTLPRDAEAGETAPAEPRAQQGGWLRAPCIDLARCRCVALALSLAANLALALALALIAKSGNAVAPPAPPPPNASFSTCPFDPAAMADDAPRLAVNGLGSTFTSLCWTDFAHDDRGLVAAPYELYLVDPWMDAMRQHLVYAGRATSVNVTDLLPATRYRFQVRRGSSSNQADEPAAAEVTTHHLGLCGNPSDVAAYHATKSTMKSNIQKCMIAHAFSDDKIQQCISHKVGLSPPCAACWVAEAHCTIKECWNECLTPTSQACKDCSEARCFPACVACSGMPRWSFPP